MRHGNHTISSLIVHVVWITKYRKKVLTGEVKLRCHELIQQICESNEITIDSGAVSSDHVHLLLEYPTKLSLSLIMKNLKGRTSKILQQEFPHIKKQYWGNHFWASGYGAWSVGDTNAQHVRDYLKHHEHNDNVGPSKIIIEND